MTHHTQVPDIVELLGRCELFCDMPAEHRRVIAGLCDSAAADKGDCVFLEGRPGAAMFILATGSIQLVKASPEGREIVIRTVGPGEIFAEAVLFEKDTYPATAIARKNSLMYRLRRQDFRALLAREQFRDSFVAHLLKRLRYLADRVLYVTTCDVEDRFFQFLRDQYGDKHEYTMPMSKKDIAAAIGTTPETLSRLAARLRKERKINWKGRTIRILGR